MDETLSPVLSSCNDSSTRNIAAKNVNRCSTNPPEEDSIAEITAPDINAAGSMASSKQNDDAFIKGSTQLADNVAIRDETPSLCDLSKHQ